MKLTFIKERCITKKHDDSVDCFVDLKKLIIVDQSPLGIQYYMNSQRHLGTFVRTFSLLCWVPSIMTCGFCWKCPPGVVLVSCLYNVVILLFGCYMQTAVLIIVFIVLV